MPPSMVQIFNGAFVFAFAFPFSMLWDKLRAKGKEPLSTVKQAIGLALIAVSYFIIAHNVKDLGNSGLLAIKWLILLYLIQTFAELCLSPIGLSLVGKLSPKRFASLLFGVFFLSNAAGYALAGSLGALIPATGDKFKKAQELGIDLQGVLDKKINPNGKELFLLAQFNLASIENKEVGEKIDPIIKQNNKFIEDAKKADKNYKLDVSKLVLPPDEIISKIESEKGIVAANPKFAGFEIHNLYEFFMVFVVLTGIAAIILFLLTPLLKKMMHGVK